MKRIFVLCIFIMVSQKAAFSAVSYFPPLQPVYSEPVQLRNYNDNLTSLPDPFNNPVNLNYSALAKIENSLYGHTFTNQNISVRLERIERSLFNTTFRNATPAQRIDNIISNFNQLNKYPNISANILTRLENKVFNRTYQQNTIENRIERLEQQVFGAVQSGDMDTRYEALVSAIKSYNTTSMNQNLIPNTGQNRGIRGIANALLNNAIFGGTMTGFTPPIDPYYGNYSNGYTTPYNPYANQNMNNFGGSGYGSYQGYRTNHGMYDGFHNYGSGASVHILD